MEEGKQTEKPVRKRKKKPARSKAKNNEIRRKEKTLETLNSIDEKAPLKPVDKIIDGIGPLILPLLGYDHHVSDPDIPYHFLIYHQPSFSSKSKSILLGLVCSQKIFYLI